MRGLNQSLNEIWGVYNCNMVATLQASVESHLAKYETMDMFRMAAALDPWFKLDWCDEREQTAVIDLMMGSLVLTPAATPASLTASSEKLTVWWASWPRLDQAPLPTPAPMKGCTSEKMCCLSRTIHFSTGGTTSTAFPVLPYWPVKSSQYQHHQSLLHALAIKSCWFAIKMPLNVKKPLKSLT